MEFYQSELTELFSTLRKRIQAANVSAGEQRRNEIRLAEAEIKDAEDLLQTMTLGARSEVGLAQASAQAKVEGFEKDLLEIKKEIKHLAFAPNQQAERELLFANSDIRVTSEDQRSRLLQTTETIAEAGSHIQNARISVHSSIDVASDVLTNLHSQRQTMEHARDTLRGINDDLTTAGRVMREMVRRAMTNKLILAAIIIALLATIGLVIWISFR